MIHPDFHAPAELYLGSTWQRAREQGARGFRTAAHAIRFAFEQAAPVSLKGAELVVEGQSYGSEQLARLYQSPEFPLQRRKMLELA